MKKAQKVLFVLSLTLLINLVCSQCPAELSLKDIETGTLEITDLKNNNQNNPTDIISFQQYSVVFSNPIKDAKIILALSEINIQNSSIDIFDINIISKTDNSFTLGFIFQTNKWKTISYKYIVTGRIDLTFGMITLNSINFNLKKDRQIQALIELNQQLFEGEKYEILSFMRGVKYKNNQLITHFLAISIVSQQISQNKLNITISVPLDTDKVELQLLSISYILFQPSKVQFASFGGLIPRQNYVGKSQYDINRVDLPTKYYTLFGLTSLKITTKNINIKTSVSQQLLFSMDSSTLVQNIQVTYFSIALKSAQVCSKCGSDNIISSAQCVSSCKDNQVVYKYKDSTSACKKCADGLIADKQTNLCLKKLDQIQSTQVNYQTEESYVPVNSLSSVEKPPSSNIGPQNTINKNIEISSSNNMTQNQQISSESYVPPIPGNNIAPTIQTTTSYSTTSYQNTTVNPPINSLEQSSAVAMTGAIGNNRQHIEQLNNPQYNQKIQYFMSCGTLPNSYWTGNSCQCKVGFKLEKGQCLPLSSQSFSNLNYKIKTHERSRRQNKINNVDNNDTPSSKVDIPTVKLPPIYNYPQTKEDDSYSESQQSEQAQNTQIGEKKLTYQNSRPISQNPSLNSTYKCLLEHEVLNIDTKKCQCITEFGYLKKDDQSIQCVICELNTGYYLEQGQCKFCGQNQVYDQFRKICMCKHKYVFNTDKKCISKPDEIDKNNKNIAINQSNQSPPVPETPSTPPSNPSTQTPPNPSSTQTPPNPIISEAISSFPISPISPPVVPIQRNQTQKQKFSEQNKKNQQKNTQRTDENRRQRGNRQQSRSFSPVISPQIKDNNGQINKSPFSNNLNKQTSQNNNSAYQKSAETKDTSSKRNQKGSQQNVQTQQNLNNSNNNSINNSTNNSSNSSTNNSTQQNKGTSQTNKEFNISEKSGQTNKAFTTQKNEENKCMKLSSTPVINTANVYTSIQLSKQFVFKSEDQMKNFLKCSFSNDAFKPSSVYCNQNQNSLKIFDCLLLYPNGVPNQDFQVNFWYNGSQSQNQCKLKINVNPLESRANSLRSLRKR